MIAIKTKPQLVTNVFDVSFWVTEDISPKQLVLFILKFNLNQYMANCFIHKSCHQLLLDNCIP